MSNPLTRLRLFLVDNYDIETFRLLCKDLSVIYDDLGGDNRISVKADRLLDLLGRQRRFEELLAVLRLSLPRPFSRAGLGELDTNDLYSALRSPPKAKGKLAKLPPRFFYPHALQRHFSGRRQERMLLTEWFLNRTEPIFAYVALGGSGKSALAWVWLVHDLLGKDIPSLLADKPVDTPIIPEEKQPKGVFWWSFQDADADFSAFINEALRYLGTEDTASSDQTTMYEKVHYLLARMQEQHILFVLDNFEQELLAYSRLNVAQLEDEEMEQKPPAHFRACTVPYAAMFLQQAASLPLLSRVLLTSRLFPYELDDMAGCRRERLQPLLAEDALAFIQAQGVHGESETIKTICAQFGYHPLTLRLLVGLTINDPVNPGDMVAVLGDANVDLPRQQQILTLAYDSLHPKLQLLLSRMSAFRSETAFDAIKVLDPFDEEAKLKRALKELIEREVVQFDRENHHYSLHPIVRRYAYDRLVDKAGVHNRLRDHFSLIPPPAQVHQIKDLAPVIELYHHTVQAGLYDDAYYIYNYNLRRPLYYELGEYEVDFQLLSAIPKNHEDLPQLSQPANQIWAMLYATMCCERTGQLELGINIVQQAIGLGRRLGNQENLAQALVPYASLCCDTGRLQLAFEAMQESTKIFDRIGDSNWIGISHRSYGRSLMLLGRFEEALAEWSITEEAYIGPRFVHGRSVLFAYMGTLHLWLEHFDKAKEYAEQARQLSQSASLEREFIHATYLLGQISTRHASKWREGRGNLISEAKDFLSQALIRCRRINLVELEAGILLAWAEWFLVQRDFLQAEKYAQDALSRANRHHYRLVQADAYNVLTKLARKQKDLEQAQEYAQLTQDRSWCDGPGYHYGPVFRQAKTSLAEIERLLVDIRPTES